MPPAATRPWAASGMRRKKAGGGGGLGGTQLEGGEGLGGRGWLGLWSAFFLLPILGPPSFDHGELLNHVVNVFFGKWGNVLPVFRWYKNVSVALICVFPQLGGSNGFPLVSFLKPSPHLACPYCNCVERPFWFASCGRKLKPRPVATSRFKFPLGWVKHVRLQFTWIRFAGSGQKGHHDL